MYILFHRSCYQNPNHYINQKTNQKTNQKINQKTNQKFIKLKNRDLKTHGSK